MDLAGLDNNSGSCGLIGYYPLHLTFPFGVAWPLQAGGVIQFIQSARRSFMILTSGTHGPMGRATHMIQWLGNRKNRFYNNNKSNLSTDKDLKLNLFKLELLVIV